MSSAEPPPFSSIIVGGGPGGLGPLLWAAQHGHLPAWLRQGVALIEQSGRLGGTLGRYGINSDSLGGSYLECLDAAGLPEALHHLRHDPTTLEMQGYRTSFPPLPLVDRYIGRIGPGLAIMLAAETPSELHLHTTAQSIHLRENGTVAVLIRQGELPPRTLIGHSAVVALGGRQPWQDQSPTPGLAFSDCTMHCILPSNALLTHAGLAQADEIMRTADGRRIVVLGGSHSAYATAWALLELPHADKLGDGQLVIVQRRPPRIFYSDSAAAAADRYEVAPGDICARTRRVNRMGGLRGHGRDIWRRIAMRPDTLPEPRVAVVALQDFSTADLRDMIEAAALVVPCLGYRSATLPIYDSSERRLDLKVDRNEDAVGDDCRLLLANGTKLENVFGIGLGTGFRPGQTMGCEANFAGQANSLWLYHNDIGAVVYRAIQSIPGVNEMLKRFVPIAAESQYPLPPGSF
jgi:hypothetical protein